MQKRLKIQKYDFRKSHEDKQVVTPVKQKGVGHHLTSQKNDPWPQLPTQEKVKSRPGHALSFRKIRPLKRKASSDFQTPDRKRKRTNSCAWYCKFCDEKLEDRGTFEEHTRSNKHKKRLERSLSKLSPIEAPCGSECTELHPVGVAWVRKKDCGYYVEVESQPVKIMVQVELKSGPKEEEAQENKSVNAIQAEKPICKVPPPPPPLSNFQEIGPSYLAHQPLKKTMNTSKTQTKNHLDYCISIEASMWALWELSKLVNVQGIQKFFLPDAVENDALQQIMSAKYTTEDSKLEVEKLRQEIRDIIVAESSKNDIYKLLNLILELRHIRGNSSFDATMFFEKGDINASTVAQEAFTLLLMTMHEIGSFCLPVVPSSIWKDVFWDLGEARWFGRIIHEGQCLLVGTSYDDDIVSRAIDAKYRLLGAESSNLDLTDFFAVDKFIQNVTTKWQRIESTNPSSKDVLDKLKAKAMDLQQNFPREIFQLTNLLALDLSDCDIMFIHPDISELCNLQLLSLRANHIRYLPLSLFQLTSLQYLDLGRNNIRILPPTIGELVHLRELYLDINPLGSIDREIVKLKCLKKLNLSYNFKGFFSRKAPQLIGSLTTLKRLDMSGLRLGNSTLRMFATLPELEVLRLSKNEIDYIDSAGKMKNLRELYLDHNHFRFIPASNFVKARFENLQLLDLRYNRLKRLPRDLSWLKGIKVLLKGNDINLRQKHCKGIQTDLQSKRDDAKKRKPLCKVRKYLLSSLPKDIASKVQHLLEELEDKIKSNNEYSKWNMAKIGRDFSVKMPLHQALLPFVLKIDLLIFLGSSRRFIQEEVFRAICTLIPYQRSHKLLTELLERFCENVINDGSSEQDDIRKLKLEWYMKFLMMQRKTLRKRLNDEIKIALSKAITRKNPIEQINVKSGIFKVGQVCDKIAELARMSGRIVPKAFPEKLQDVAFRLIAKQFPRKYKIGLDIVRAFYESEKRKMFGTKCGNVETPRNILVKEEPVPSVFSITNIICSIEAEIAYVENANDEFMETIFIYENLHLKHMRALLEKAQVLASRDACERKASVSELVSIQEQVMDLSKQIRTACDIGVKREELVVINPRKEADSEITQEKIFNALYPFEGYLATKEAIDVLIRNWKQKEIFINSKGVLPDLAKSQQKRIVKNVKACILEQVPKILDHGGRGEEWKPGICVKDSSVCGGLGLFAMQDFKAGMLIGLLLGKLMTEEEAEFYYGPGTRARERASYICSIPVGEETLIIDPFNFSSRVNHAGILGDSTPVDTENMAWVEIIYQGIPYIAEVVIRDIKTGEEILTNYGKSYHADPFLDPETKPSALIMKSAEVYFKSRFIDLTDLPDLDETIS